MSGEPRPSTYSTRTITRHVALILSIRVLDTVPHFLDLLQSRDIPHTVPGAEAKHSLALQPCRALLAVRGSVTPNQALHLALPVMYGVLFNLLA